MLSQKINISSYGTANRSNFDGKFALSSCFADWLPYMSGNFFENFFVKYEVKFVLEVIL